MTTPDRHDGANAQHCDAKANRLSGWKHFALAERAAKFGYWRTTFSDGKMFWSPGMYRLLGVDPGMQVADSNWLLSQIAEDDVAYLMQAIETAIETKSPFYYRTRSKDPNVTAHIVDTHGEVEIDENGCVVAVIGVCHDVTAQVTAEAEREIAQARYCVMTEQASDIIVLNENDRIVCASSALDRILKRKPEEFQNGGFLQFVHPDDLVEAKKLRGRPEPGEIWTATYRVQHAEGHYIWFEVSTRGVYDEETGEFRQEISVGRDITERKEHELRMKAAQERAETASKAKSLFFANMSHELRTPLNAIIGFTDIMCTEVFGPLNNTRYSEYTGLIRDSGKHLLDLIGDILDVAKIDAGKMELTFEPVDLGNSIRDSVPILSERARASDIALTVDLPEDALMLSADKRALMQIVLNLVSNAVKFTPPGGHVAVGARATGEAITLFVRDNGIGIPAHALSRLGTPFEQVCTDPMLAKDGAGLGLTLVRSFAEKHGGTMRLESEVGTGTEVTIQFPAQPARKTA